jgi:hypothetical protein
MNQLFFLLVAFSSMPACTGVSSSQLPADEKLSGPAKVAQNTIGEITVPAGYSRLVLSDSSFGTWLRKVSLKKDNTVYLYNGTKKLNQSAQYAVLDVSVGKEDLQQCADAVMRLRAEYFFNRGEYTRINFKASDGTVLSFADWRNGFRYRLQGNKLLKEQSSSACTNLRQCFDAYLRVVFSYCGTASLQQSLQRVKNIRDIRAGDVWIEGGYPGHAMIVMDVAASDRNERIFLLAQSYMPAQDVHVVRNPADDNSPWYKAAEGQPLYTPEWTFASGCLYRF